ncbi:tRNA-intron lyase [Halorubellus sp. JP-L1]|uniref:tRNA-intron lyase n=1 Tax=Halorubellus sp. JP-L1 TaxID=2715753 RepID=UPI00140A64BC|nr:tRNA-intron lyase [Halorubellus sp. JP-L1]NHN41741.1 tRNA-intron lyase [Halorubellus sp. JP-L1]
MNIEGHVDGDVVHVGHDARQRFHDSRGYGYPLEGNDVALAPVEAAHLLARGDLASVDGMDFRAFVRASDDPTLPVRYLVYADLRERGFYCAPAHPDWTAFARTDGTADDAGGRRGDDFVVFPRGSGPGDGEIAYRVRVSGERTSVPARALGDCVLAVVDEESEITYLETRTPEVSGTVTPSLPESASADLLADRVTVWGPAGDALYERGFYGTPLSGRDTGTGAIVVSLVEAAHLAANDALDVPADVVVARGRDVEGERYDRRLAAYRDLRAAGVAPKTGFKFGADFRTYADFESPDDVGHSERLVRVLPSEHAFAPRDLALDVRLANGVKKTMTFALVDATGDGPATGDETATGDDGATVEWLAISRLTP